MHRNRSRRACRGFTLVEIILVIAITGIIAVGLTYVILTAEIDLSVAAVANAVGAAVRVMPAHEHDEAVAAVRPHGLDLCTGVRREGRLDAANAQELDYYLLPRLDLPDQEIRVSNKNSADFECFRFDDLKFFYGMSERESLQRRV